MLAIKRDSSVQPPAVRPSRRGFLIGAAAAGAGLTIGFQVPLRRGVAAEPDAINPLMAYVRIAPDSTVTVLSAHMDGGQGIYTGLATLVAEELGRGLGQMRAEGAWGNPKLYGNPAWGGAIQGTGGSSSIPGSWERYRKAGAIARAMLVEAAAQGWGVPAGEIRVEKGMLSHRLRQVRGLRRAGRHGGHPGSACRRQAEGPLGLGPDRQREAAPARIRSTRPRAGSSSRSTSTCRAC